MDESYKSYLFISFMRQAERQMKKNRKEFLTKSEAQKILNNIEVEKDNIISNEKREEVITQYERQITTLIRFVSRNRNIYKNQLSLEFIKN